MSIQFLRSLLFTLIVFSTASSQAGWLCKFLESIPRDTKRRNCWPKPFVCPDRQFARVPFALQVANGWQRQNILNSYHFEKAAGQLNEAGRLKVRWILYEEPAQHRSIYVQIGQTPEETEARLQAVQEYAAQIMPQGDLPLITTTTISDEGWSAERVDLIGRKYQATMPAPRLPPPDDQTGSSGSGT